jgi:hypothetical protein
MELFFLPLIGVLPKYPICNDRLQQNNVNHFISIGLFKTFVKNFSVKKNKLIYQGFVWKKN